MLNVAVFATAASALADVHYVDVNSTNATPPYTSWTTASMSIQDAVDAAAAGDEIVVTNGFYRTGGRNGSRVSVDKALTIRSVNGPQFTSIGATRLIGRCASLTNGASLAGFTLTGGYVQPTGDGGGVRGGTLNNCTLIGNSAGNGGGAYGCTLNHCTLRGNSALSSGGGSSLCTLNNCTLTDNSADLGGGAAISVLNNCTLTFNSASGQGFGHTGASFASTFNNCIGFGNSYQTVFNNVSIYHCEDCDSPGRVAGFNYYGDPLFVDGSGWANPRLQSNSPCINAGNNSYVTSATDLDGNPRIVGGTVDIGAYEFQAVRYVDVNSTNATPPYSSWATAATNIQDAVDVAVPGDEIVVTNGIYATGGRAVSGTMTNRVAVDKPLALRSVNGPQFTIILGSRASSVSGNGDGAIRCVYLTNGASLSGFTLTSGFTRVVNDYPTNSQSAGGGLWCESNNEVVVSNCVVSGNSAFFGGGGAYQGTLNNCTLTNNFAPLTYGRGGGAYGCILNNCTLSGNAAGFRPNIISGATAAGSGGGAFGCTLNNCALNGNLAYSRNSPNDAATGGGACSSTLNNCTLTGNSALTYNSFTSRTTDCYGGGASLCTLNNCTLTGNLASGSGFFAFGYGGGASFCTVNNCTLAGNSAPNGSGGGVHVCTVNNCTLTGNSADLGGGAANSVLDNCTLAGNSASSSGGASGGWLNNCVVYSNNPDNYGPFSTLNYCCTLPAPGGIGNITNAPLFVDTNGWVNLRLQCNSPCINAGRNAFAPAGPDLDGNPRIAGGTVDMGAYELQSPASLISYAWLQQFNLPINPGTDTADPDGDGVDNYHEWLAGSDPTNPFSSPAQLTITPSGTNVIVTWPTNAGGFTLQSTTNLGAVWSTNFPAPVVIGEQNVVINPITGPQKFFRLRQ